MGAFSCDRVVGGGTQLLKHCGISSSSGVSQFFARVWAQHTLVGRSESAVTAQIVWPAAPQTQPPVPPGRTEPGPPLGYGPAGLPPLDPGALTVPVQGNLFT